MRPYVFFALLGAVLYGITLGLVSVNWIPALPTYTISILLFLFFVTAMIYRYIARFASAGPEMVTRFYLLSIALKLMAACAFILFLMLDDPDGARQNTVFFLCGYVSFTAMEIAFLFRLRKH